MRCKIDNGTLDHIEQNGYVDTWKCRRCRVIWEMKPEADFDTNKEVMMKLLEQKLTEFENERKYNGYRDSARTS